MAIQKKPAPKKTAPKQAAKAAPKKAAPAKAAPKQAAPKQAAPEKAAPKKPAPKKAAPKKAAPAKAAPKRAGATATRGLGGGASTALETFTKTVASESGPALFGLVEEVSGGEGDRVVVLRVNVNGKEGYVQYTSKHAQDPAMVITLETNGDHLKLDLPTYSYDGIKRSALVMAQFPSTVTAAELVYPGSLDASDIEAHSKELRARLTETTKWTADASIYIADAWMLGGKTSTRAC